MVLGIGEGKIEIVLPKLVYSYGERIKGKAVLALNQPKNAKGLKIELKAERKVWSTRRSSGKTSRAQHTETVYSFVLPLKGEGQFSSGEYDFEVAIPEFEGQQRAQSPLKISLGPFSAGGSDASPLAWYIIASLDLPLSFDINKKIQISVSNSSQ